MSITVRCTAIALLLLGASFAHATPPDCPPLTGGNALKLEIDEYHLSLNNKKPICIVLGGTINIKIHNPPGADHDVEAGDVTAEQKADSPYVIVGDNSADENYLTLTVTEFPSGGGTDAECGDGTDECAKFWINVDHVGQLDPRVRVVEGTRQMGNYQIWLQEVLDDLDLTLEEATEILNYSQKGE